MAHKIDQRQYNQLYGFWPQGERTAAERLLAGEGTDIDLSEVARVCIEHGHNALARELLMPPDQLEENHTTLPLRRKPPAERTGETHKVKIEGVNCFITANEYDDGSLCEVFVTIDKHGAEMRLLDEVAIFLSVGLQYGIPLEVYVSKMRGTRIGTKGFTDDPEFRKASSVLDFLAQWLEDRYIKVLDKN